jgi:small-conductance mechanosensitive channel
MCFEGIIPVVVSLLTCFVRYIYYGIMILGWWCLTIIILYSLYIIPSLIPYIKKTNERHIAADLVNRRWYIWKQNIYITFKSGYEHLSMVYIKKDIYVVICNTWYSVTLNQVMVVIVKLLKWWLLSMKSSEEPYGINWGTYSPYADSARILLHINGKALRSPPWLG